jgi:hypothetical protein
MVPLHEIYERLSQGLGSSCGLGGEIRTNLRGARVTKFLSLTV